MSSGCFDERRVLVQGLSTVYFEAGEGSAVLLLHGSATSPRDWERIARELGSTHRVLALALPGYGDTSPLGDVRPAAVASFVASFLDRLGVEEVIMVGHSYGGLVALEFALSRPQRVTRLVLADSAGLGRAVNPALVVLASAPRPVVSALVTAMLLPGGALLRTLLTGLQLRHPWRVPLHAWFDQARLTHSRTFLTTSVEVVKVGVGLTGLRPQYNVADRLSEIHVPVLVIWGLTDLIFPFWQAVRAVRELPSAKLAIIPDAGHVTHLDSHEEFCDALGPFVRDDPDPVRRGATEWRNHGQD
ncbi:alpha/beta fold hydrolase [Nonomuraea sp. NPDC003560]|uniref:alpha/beta fold hydrolase n=1 Tax=Nonomuraea sp. NPDC003560 TaxID=3364341 RepID=UPI0036C32329